VRRTDRRGIVRAYGDPEGRDHDWAALALSELYGLTGSNLWKDAASRAIEACHPKPALLIISARLAGLPFEPGEALHDHLGSPAERLLARYTSREWRDFVASRPLFLHGRDREADAIRLKLDPADLTKNVLPTFAIYDVDGPHGRFWKQWTDPLKRITLELNDRDGGYRPPHGQPGQKLGQTIAAMLSLEVYYRYANVLAGR
jgi:hypothetical protein